MDIKNAGTIFTNSIDHAIDPESAYQKFLSYLVTGGVLAVSFDVDTVSTSKTDCSTFSINKVSAYLSQLEKNKQISICHMSMDSLGYYLTIVQKK